MRTQIIQDNELDVMDQYVYNGTIEFRDSTNVWRRPQYLIWHENILDMIYIYIELSLDALSVTYPVLFVLLPLIHRTFLSPILPSPILSSPILSSYAILSSPILPSYPLILFRPSIPSSSPALSYPLLSYPPITLYDVINRQTSLREYRRWRRWRGWRHHDGNWN